MHGTAPEGLWLNKCVEHQGQKGSSNSAKPYESKSSSWWLNQPIWKLLVKIGSFPQIGVNIKNDWNHQLSIHQFLVGACWCRGKAFNHQKQKQNMPRSRDLCYPLFGGHDFAFEFGSRFQLTIPKTLQTRRIAGSVSFCHQLLSCTAFLRRKPLLIPKSQRLIRKKKNVCCVFY